MLPTFPTPYYAVIFTSLRADNDPEYISTNDMLEEMATDIHGFLGTESSRDAQTGLGVSVSYWATKEAIEDWRKHTHHQMAKAKAISQWYTQYSIRIAKVENDNFFEKKD